MGKNQTVTEFAKQYGGLDLLTHTNSSVSLGDLYIKKAIGKNRLEFSGYNVAFKIGITPEEASSLKKRLRKVQNHIGSFAGISIKDSFSAEGGMSIPSVNVELDGKVDRSKVLGFEIGKIKTKVLRDALRLKIEQAIEQLKKEDPKEYRKELKRLFIAEQLFYSDSVKITVEKNIDIDVNAVFAESAGKVSVGLDSHKNQVFTISGSKFPFAVDLKQLKDFI